MTQALSFNTRPRAASRRGAGLASSDYFHQSRLPLPSLVILLPLLAFYEVGTRLWATDGQSEVRIVAFNLLQDFLWLFGASGQYLPAMAVVGILLAWHIARRDPWHVRPALLGKMMAESLVLAVPVLLLGALAARAVPMMALGEQWPSLVVMSVGAGIYEELIFRLIAFTALSLILVDGLRLRPNASVGLILLIPAVLFALYHYLGTESFGIQSFVFRTAAGVYFGIVYLFRGFGITAFTHVIYDLIVVSMMGLSPVDR